MAADQADGPVSQSPNSPQGNSDQLSGWKEIAAYIGKGVRQAQRWERLGMPVHRVHAMDGVVYAFRSEIDAWRTSASGREADDSDKSALEMHVEPLPADQPVNTHPQRDIPKSQPRLLRWAWILPAAAIAVGSGGYVYYATPALSIELSSADEAGQGGSFRFSASGGEPELKLAYRIMGNPRGGEHVVSPAVPRDPDGRFVWVFSTDCQTPPGRHTISLADSAGKVLTKALSVVVRENPACLGPVPDLQADLITLSQEKVAAGGTLRCRFTLSNRGARPANPSTTRLRLSRSPMRSSVSDLRLADVAAPMLSPGEETAFEPIVTIPASVAPGVYYIWVVADNASDNVESFTHNNYVKSGPLLIEAQRK